MVVTAQNAATVAANLAKDDELGKMILALKKSGKTKKEPSDAYQFQRRRRRRGADESSRRERGCLMT